MHRRIVLLAALGYFVDIVDLVLFSVLRIPSLRAIGVPDAQLLQSGLTLLNYQMAGLLVGGLLWGVLGDKKGRVTVLYASILLYSLATAANAFVTSVDAYCLCRLLAGIGLSGELGAAITLVSETLPGKSRGWGTTIVAGIGLCGGTVAALMSDHFAWKTCYLIGGGAGLLLLVLRLRLIEPALFLNLDKSTKKGSLLLLVRSPKRLLTFFSLIGVGTPIWFVGGILMVFSPEFGKALGVDGNAVTAGKAVLVSYMGMVLGDFMSGLLSQWWQSRRRVLLTFILGLGGGTIVFLTAKGISTSAFYAICFVIGISTGYWAVLITTAAEHFGTNLRSTVTTTVPNLIRASALIMTFLFRKLMLDLSLIESALWLGTGCLALSLLSLFFLRETYARDLNFVEN